MLETMNHMSRGGGQSGFQRDMEGRENEYPSSSVSMEVQPVAPFFSGSNADPHSHSSITENRSLSPVTPVGQHVHCTNYNVPSMHDMEAGPLNCPMGNGGSLKRKRSDMYGAGSSSSSSQIPMEKPGVDWRSVPSYRDSLTIAGEDSPRNVRRRCRIDFEPSRTHVPNHSSHFYQSASHPANYSAPVQHPNLNTNAGRWNCVPRYADSSDRRILHSEFFHENAGISGSRHETTRFHVGGSSADVGSCHHDPVFSRHQVSSSRNLHAPNTREGHVTHSRRIQSSYGNGSRYSHYAHGGTSSTNGLENLSSRNSRNWNSTYSSGRPRLAVERLHSAHDRIRHETSMMVDRASHRNFSDQYRDLRLDIDNMTYEELLNLEERIGNVSTGLSEDGMSKCLREKAYCSSDKNHAEVFCPICLEEYRNGDKIGTMEKCGHGYHVDCIKKWLLMKKLCPICKTECSNQVPCEG